MSDILKELQRVSRCVFKDGWESADLHARAGIEIAALRARIAKLSATPQENTNGGEVERCAQALYEHWNNYPACTASDPWAVRVEKQPGSAKFFRGLAAIARAALAHQPLSVPSILPAPSDRITGQLHEWDRSGHCTECRCLYVGLDRKDPCPGPAAPKNVGGEE